MPPHLLLRGVIILLFSGTFSLAAQSRLTLVATGTTDSIAVNAYVSEAGDGPALLRADWTGLEGRAPAFKVYRPALGEAGPEIELVELLLAGVEQYLDQRIHFTRNGVRTDLPVSGLHAGVDRMWALATAYFGSPVVRLSEASLHQLERICSIDWSQASFGVDGGGDHEKYLAISFYVRAQRQELERQFRKDLAPLTGMQLPKEPEEDAADPGERTSAMEDPVFDEENYLRALDLRADTGAALPDIRLTDAMLAEIAAKAQLSEDQTRYKLRKRDRWLKAELDAINRRIDQSDQRKELWAMRDRMDAIEERLDGLGSLVEEIDRERHAPAPTENPVASLSSLTGKNVHVLFPRGSAELDGNAKVLLEEVASAMRESPQGRALVTGHADPSGSVALNLALSEQRAKAVRSYLMGRGIEGSRLLLNFHGASRSQGSGSADRRVEIEWVR